LSRARPALPLVGAGHFLGTSMKPSQLVDSRFKPAKFIRQIYVAQPEYGVMLTDVLKSDYWRHVASHLRPGALIEVQPEGLTYFAQLIVIDSGTNWAKVKLLSFVDLLGEAKAPDQEPVKSETTAGAYTIKRAGAWFQVIRTSDREVIKTGFRVMADAESWVNENLKVS
jgi:hypothetical protein